MATANHFDEIKKAKLAAEEAYYKELNKVQNDALNEIKTIIGKYDLNRVQVAALFPSTGRGRKKAVVASTTSEATTQPTS